MRVFVYAVSLAATSIDFFLRKINSCTWPVTRQEELFRQRVGCGLFVNCSFFLVFYCFFILMHSQLEAVVESARVYLQLFFF